VPLAWCLSQRCSRKRRRFAARGCGSASPTPLWGGVGEGLGRGFARGSRNLHSCAIALPTADRNLAGWADARFPARPMTCIIHPDNAASLRLAAKPGFRGGPQREGHPAFAIGRFRETASPATRKPAPEGSPRRLARMGGAGGGVWRYGCQASPPARSLPALALSPCPGVVSSRFPAWSAVIALTAPDRPFATITERRTTRGG
jgi:hypothetical protein